MAKGQKPSEKSLSNLHILKKGDTRTMEVSRKGVEARLKKAQDRATLKESLKTLLKVSLKKGEIVEVDEIMDLADIEDINIDVQTAISIATIQRALQGDIQAVQFIRDTIGEKPSDKVELDQSLTIESWAKAHKVKL